MDALCGGHSIHTVIDLIRLSPLLIDEDYGHEDDDLSHNAKKRPESSQTTADTQVDLVVGGAQITGSRAPVVSKVIVNVQVTDGQTGLVVGVLDRIFLSGAIGETLRIIFEQQVSNKYPCFFLKGKKPKVGHSPTKCQLLCSVS